MTWALVGALGALGPSVWVFLDARNRGLGGKNPFVSRALLWAAAVFLFLPLTLPLYLLWGRPVGNLVPCASCRRPTLAHLAYCLHCGAPLDFQAPPAGWGLGEMIGVTLVFVVTLPLLAGLAGFFPSPTLAQISVYVVVQNALFIGLSQYVVQQRYHLPPGILGWQWSKWSRNLLLGILIGILALGLSILTEEAAVRGIGQLIGRDQALELAEREHTQDPIQSILRFPLSPPELVWIALLTLVVVPVGEETFFRGLVLVGLRSRWGAGFAVWISAAFFALLHQQVVHFLPILILGVILGYLRERTGTLLAGIAVHAVNNAAAILGAYLSR